MYTLWYQPVLQGTLHCRLTHAHILPVAPCRSSNHHTSCSRNRVHWPVSGIPVLLLEYYFVVQPVSTGVSIFFTIPFSNAHTIA